MKWYEDYKKWLNDRPGIPYFAGESINIKPVLYVEGGADYIVTFQRIGEDGKDESFSVTIHTDEMVELMQYVEQLNKGQTDEDSEDLDEES